jgi:hypothetical protein
MQPSTEKSCMRLAALSLFFLTFAATIWIASPTTSTGARIEPVGLQLSPTAEPELPQLVTSLGPDLPPEPLDAEDIATLNACANDPEMPTECRVASIGRLFRHYLRPPADINRVRAVLTDTRWVSEANINYIEVWLGPPIGELWNHVSFRVSPSLNNESSYGRLWVRVSGPPKLTPDDLRAFLCGETSRVSGLQIEEFAWQDDDPRLLVEHYARHRVTKYFCGREVP